MKMYKNMFFALKCDQNNYCCNSLFNCHMDTSIWIPLKDNSVSKQPATINIPHTLHHPFAVMQTLASTCNVNANGAILFPHVYI